MQGRPPHLRDRQVMRFATDALLIRKGRGARNSYGEWVDGIAEVRQVKVFTVPRARSNRAAESGERVEETREFWTSEFEPVVGETSGGGLAADFVVWGGVSYKVDSHSDWGEFHAFTGVRADPQMEVELPLFGVPYWTADVAGLGRWEAGVAKGVWDVGT